MKSSKPGTDTLGAEVVHISEHGLWLAVFDREYHLPYEQYPWFREAKIADVLNVELLHGRHLHWPALDVDLVLDSLKNPAAYPLISD